ncbi:MAG: hypothetical protein Q7S03_04020 [bacterium]|nr:hypothetical protein [bacterium]
MILGSEELLKLVKEGKLIQGLCDRELENPEGAGFDLRIGEIYELVGEGFLGIEERETPEMKLLAKYDPEKPTIFSLEPGKYYIAKTIETFNNTEEVLTLFRPRSTLHRSGIALFSGFAHPSYNGGFNVGLINFGTKPFKIEMGARFIHAMFYEVKGPTTQYRGQWQGGRTTTEKRERQI